MPRDYQPSFTGGEIAPGLHGRADLARYQTSLALCKNWFVHAQGGISTRPGLQFIYENPADVVRLIPFSFNTEQTYMLMFSHLKMRVIYNDGTGSGVVLVSPGGAVFELATPYTEEDLFGIRFTQSADVMTLTHEDYVPHELSRTDHNVWSIDPLNFTTDLVPPTNVTSVEVGSTPTTGAKTYRYRITSANDEGDESLPTDIIAQYSSKPLSDTKGIKLEWDTVVDATYYNVYKEQSHLSGTFGFIGEADIQPDTTNTIVSITANATPVVTMTDDHNLETGDAVWMENIDGEVEYEALNDQYHIITKTGAKTFTITASTFTASNQHNSTWWVAPGNTLTRPGFTDYNLGPDIGVTPPIGNNPFDAAGKYPRGVTYYQQRLSFGGSINYPQTFWLTKTGDYDNMDYSRPRRADDSIEVGLAAAQVNEIRHLIVLEDLMVLTSGGAWAIKAADDTDVLTPSSIKADRQGGRGCSHVRPLEVGGSALFLEDKGARVWNLAYTFERDKHVTADLSILAEHLFFGYQVVDWCYAEEPYSMIWAVRNDGMLLALTYMQDQEVWGWTQHETDGFVLSVGAITEGDEDAVYMTVRRTVDGSTRTYIERLSTRKFLELRDAVCVDSSLSYDGGSSEVSSTTRAAICTVTATAHGFSNGDIIWLRNIPGMTELNDRQYKVASAATNTFVITDFEDRDIDTRAYRAYDTAIGGGQAEPCTNMITNLGHLEGETITSLADGNVLSGLTVTGGQVDLPVYVNKIHLGLGYNCDIKTLPVDFQGQGTTQGRKKSINRLSVRVENTKGLSAGADFDTLYDIKERNPGLDYRNITVNTGVEHIDMAVNWTDDGQVCIRQAYPLPATILGIAPEVAVK